MKLILTIIVFLSVPLFVLAAPCVSIPPPCPEDSICLPNPLKYTTFDCLVDSVMNFIFVIAMALAPLMILIGAFHLLTAGGDPGKVKTAKTVFIYTGIGILIVLFARGLIAVIRAAIGVSP